MVERQALLIPWGFAGEPQRSPGARGAPGDPLCGEAVPGDADGQQERVCVPGGCKLCPPPTPPRCFCQQPKAHFLSPLPEALRSCSG